jgi:ATPase subunit of ABC transporter with duplicated ATPase domains
MTSKFVFFENVSFSYESMAASLLHDFSASFSAGWTGIVGANGAGKTTVLKLACGLLEPREGRVQLPGSAAYCSQRTDDIPPLLESLIEAGDLVASKLKGELGIESGWENRWDSLSHGERKRAQIAVALWQQPAVLALDEPTNHIDADARAMLMSALQVYQGIGLLVSHDRELLDVLCHHCLFLNPPDVVLRPGNYSSGRREAIREEEHLQSRKKLAKQHAARLRKEAQRRMLQARNTDRKLSKRNLDPRDHDRRARIDLARFTGIDGRTGRLARRMQFRSEQASQAAEEIKVRKRYELGIWVDGERCRRNILFRLPAGAIRLGTARELQHPDLIMLPDDRIALTGANGSGKSTLVKSILKTADLPPDRLTYLPQEIDIKSSCQILAEVLLQPSKVLGKVMTVVSRLGSRPANLLNSAEPSPGEMRKLLLALGIALQPHLIIMDEPTNHLDLPSIECLEEALLACPCGLLLVSHDEQLLRRLTRTRWHIARIQTPGESKMALHLL